MTARHVLPGGSAASVSQRYDVSFLEYGGTNGARLDDRQLLSLEKLLDTNRKKYVLVFVHGWHHNAQVGDRDVRRMHTFLSYTRSFLNQRPAYRDTDLIGVYVGWRGSIHDSGFQSPLDVLTYASRKRESERVAPAVMADLYQVAGRLRLDQGNSRADKMLVIGHSFGGNLLATGLKQRVLAQLDDHQNGKVIAPPLGDLTVMFNPAGEARKFIDIQRKIRDDKISFPPSQPPGYMAITATTDWNQAELCDDAPNTPQCLKSVDYDTATAIAFRAGQILFNFKLRRQDTTTIGHFRPTHAFPYGATHDLTAIKGSEFDTSYGAGAVPESSVCKPAEPWLPKLRSQDPLWDTRYTPGVRPTITDSNPRRMTEYQLRAYLFRKGSNERFSARIGNEPYWNIRSLPNLVQGHNDFVSYIVICMLNQFVLDDVGGLHKSKIAAAD